MTLKWDFQHRRDMGLWSYTWWHLTKPIDAKVQYDLSRCHDEKQAIEIIRYRLTNHLYKGAIFRAWKDGMFSWSRRRLAAYRIYWKIRHGVWIF